MLMGASKRAGEVVTVTGPITSVSDGYTEDKVWTTGTESEVYESSSSDHGIERDSAQSLDSMDINTSNDNSMIERDIYLYDRAVEWCLCVWCMWFIWTISVITDDDFCRREHTEHCTLRI